VDSDLVGAATQSVLSQTSGGDLESLALTLLEETGDTFHGWLDTEEGDPIPEDGVLQTSDGQLITVTYEDADDGTGNPAVSTATATVDCVGPVVTDVAVTVTSFTRATVTFTTDEPSTAYLRYGTSCGALTETSATTPEGTTHEIVLADLDSFADFFFVIVATDRAGNETVDDAGGTCHQFDTGTNTALHFNGNEIAAADWPNSIQLTTGLTVEAWVNNRYEGEVVSVREAYGYRAYALTVSHSFGSQGSYAYLRVRTDASSGYVSTPAGSVPIGAWVHIAGTYDGSTARIYVNGEEIDSGELTGVLRSQVRVMVGAVGDRSSNPSNYLRGAVAGIRIWNVARTGTEIRTLMEQRVSGDEPGLVAAWRFDEGYGDRAYDLTENGIDLQLGEATGPDDRNPTWGPRRAYPMEAFVRPPVARTIDDLECVAKVLGPKTGEFSYAWVTEHGQFLIEPIVVENETFYPTESVLSHHFTHRSYSYGCVTHVITEAYFAGTLSGYASVINSTPTAPLVHIYPESPDEFSSLSAVVTGFSVDYDGDEIEYEVRWYRSTDMGETFEYLPFLSVPPYGGLFIPPGYALEGEVWRVEVVPFEVGGFWAEGEHGWDQVYIGEDSRPVVEILKPSVDTFALPSVDIVWNATDADGDPVTVDIFYDTDRVEGGALPIVLGQPETGFISWIPPTENETSFSPDLDGSGTVSAEDLFILASRWYRATETERHVIFARAWAKGTTGEAFSDGDVTVPVQFPTGREGLLELLRQWHGE